MEPFIQNVKSSTYLVFLVTQKWVTKRSESIIKIKFMYHSEFVRTNSKSETLNCGGVKIMGIGRRHWMKSLDYWDYDYMYLYYEKSDATLFEITCTCASLVNMFALDLDFSELICAYCIHAQTILELKTTRWELD